MFDYVIFMSISMGTDAVQMVGIIDTHRDLLYVKARNLNSIYSIQAAMSSKSGENPPSCLISSKVVIRKIGINILSPLLYFCKNNG